MQWRRTLRNRLDFPVRRLAGSGEREESIRAILKGKTHKGLTIETHETELAPGMAPHAPHHHVHEEMIFIREGTLEVTITSKSQKLGPGSVAFVASNEEHGWRNVGTTQARYSFSPLDKATPKSSFRAVLAVPAFAAASDDRWCRPKRHLPGGRIVQAVCPNLRA